MMVAQNMNIDQSGAIVQGILISGLKGPFQHPPLEQPDLVAQSPQLFHGGDDEQALAATLAHGEDQRPARKLRAGIGGQDGQHGVQHRTAGNQERKIQPVLTCATQYLLPNRQFGLLGLQRLKAFDDGIGLGSPGVDATKSVVQDLARRCPLP